MKLKKGLQLLIVSTMLIGNTLAVSANELNIESEISSTDNVNEINEDYIVFSDNQKIDSNGNFYFGVTYQVNSNKFKIEEGETSIKITSSAIIENAYGEDVTHKYPGHGYEIRLYENNFYKGSADFTANGDEESKTFSGLSSDDTYYIKIMNSDKLPEGTEVVGQGNISNYGGAVK